MAVNPYPKEIKGLYYLCFEWVLFC